MEGREKLAILLLCAVFLTAGCTLSYKGVAIPPADKIQGTELQLPKYFDPNAPPSATNQLICKELPGDTPCGCMTCENKTPWQAYIPLLTAWYDNSLKGGWCYFRECNEEIFIDMIDDTGSMEQPRMFMFGQGPSFVSAGRANQFCNYSLQIATKWMKGNNTAPRIQLPSRAKCWLDRNILPLYLYYTGSTVIDPGRSLQIAQKFDREPLYWLNQKGVGPALLATEVDPDLTKPGAPDAVKGQILAYDKCDKCLTVLSVKSGDKAALESILGPPDNIDPTYYPKVDVVGFGFRANDYATCNLNEIIAKNFEFSRYVLNKYHKPTLWTYVGVSEGNSSDGSCQWSPEMVHNFYQNTFSLAQGLASSGVIGMSYYEFSDRSGPLPCNGIQGCSFGLFTGDQQKHPALNTWSDMCGAYGTTQMRDTTNDFRSPLVYSRNGYGSVCDFAQNNKLYQHVSDEVNSQQGLKFDEIVPMDRIKGLGCGGVCVSEAKMTKPEIYDNTNHQFPESHCTEFSFIDQYADDADLDNMYFRAVVQTESNYDPLVVSCTNKPCLVGSKTVAQLCAEAGMTGCHTLYGDGTSCPSSKQYVCAMGIAQCIDPPGDRDKYTDGCRGEDDFYNPFDPAENACCGVNKFREYLDMAQEFIDSNWATLSDPACPDSMTLEERPWAYYFLASNYYNGGPASKLIPSISQFVSQRDSPEKCDGEDNYIKLARSKNSYGAVVMSYYADAVDNKCESDCPGKK